MFIIYYRVDKLKDELKQVKAILKSPMLYYKYRDKTFDEISQAYNTERNLLDADFYEFGKGQTLI